MNKIMEASWKKNTILFMSGQALSIFGTMVVQYAIMWHITLKTQSGIMLTVVSLISFFPMFIISPFAGVWADRYNRKYIINVADGMIALISLIVGIFLAFGVNNIEIILICAFVRSIGEGIQEPAVGAVIPQIVPKEYLTKINGYQSSIQSLISLTSPILSGVLMTFTPLQTLFFLDVFTAIIGIIIVLFFVKIPKLAKNGTEIPEKNGSGYFKELKEGLAYIKNHRLVFSIIAITSIMVFLSAPGALLAPLQVIRNFGDDVWRLSVTKIAVSIGMLVGGLLIGTWGGFKNHIHTMAFACVLFGVFLAGLGMTQFFPLYLVFLALFGISFPVYNTPAIVLMQSTVEPAVMGRVMSIFSMIASTMRPLAMIIFGPLVDSISINILFVITGIMAVFLGIIIISNKTLRIGGADHLQKEGNKNK